ncbi:MAG: phosphoribosylformylglycinamidine synthase subunit PurL [Armatimonadetes bacterium]|nr:phosphoribosylformylglycinamidine synthase subunit PurL [Armatimonadota bacterium]
MLVITETQWRSLGLLEPEYREIISRQGREPSPTELAMYSVEWSEHCGYSRSRSAIKSLPRQGRYPVLVGQDAGGIVWDDLAILFKVESHNHPSQVQPRHGAATGVGGIIRDILANGARPIALLDSLRFGTDPDSYRILQGVVDGIQFYGNCVGVPTVGGETCFHPGYNGNCLVNVMCIGLAPRDKLATARAVPGHSVMYLGSRTGRDGIGGCSVLASQDLGEADKRPSVQIGDPFAGKCLIEATLEAIATGHILAVKDMGAAGLTCTTSEMSAEGNCGMALSLDTVPLREHPMAPYEIMMSESQERMLAVVRKGKEQLISEIFHKWGLEAEVMGITTERPVLEISHKGSIVAELSPENLTSPPMRDLPTGPPKPRLLPDIVNLMHPSPSEALLRLLGSPNLCGKHWIYEQYDHMVQVNTVVRPGEGDAAVLRIKGTQKAIAATFDGNSRYTLLDPHRGGVLAVAEAARIVEDLKTRLKQVDSIDDVQVFLDVNPD